MVSQRSERCCITVGRQQPRDLEVTQRVLWIRGRVKDTGQGHDLEVKPEGPGPSSHQLCDGFSFGSSKC